MDLVSTINKTALGLEIPLRNGENGYFNQTFDTVSQTKTNIFNLLNTIPGERRMMPTFGSRLWTVVFEQADTIITEKVTRIIKEDISIWVPSVIINNVTVKYNNEENQNLDIYKLYITIDFSIPKIEYTDSIELIINPRVF
jgi:phage baseplate assembly protein W